MPGEKEFPLRPSFFRRRRDSCQRSWRAGQNFIFSMILFATLPLFLWTYYEVGSLEK